jgi:small-conductance mechanosensitive channel
MLWEKILSFNLWGNSGENYLKSIGLFVFLILVFFLTQKIITAKIKKVTEKTKNDVDDFVLGVVQDVKPPFYIFISLYIAIQPLNLDPTFNKVIYGTFLLVIVVQLILTAQRAIDYVMRKKIITGDGDENRESMISTLGQIAKWLLWTVGALLVLSNLGIDVTSLVAGLGIGGIAVALAAQNILGDVFASFSIYVDKPFEVGDFIKINKDMGTVLKIGIKTTRIKTLKGNEMSIPNKKLTDAELHNFTRMEERRKIFNIGVAYETPKEKLEKIKPIMIEIFKSLGDKVKLERVHFKGFGDSSLNFEISFSSQETSFKEFMDILENLNFKIFERFNAEEIDFAYPTQTIHLEKGNNS